MPRPRRLTNISLREVSLVDRPASPGARVLLYKRDGEEFSPCEGCESSEACTKAGACSTETSEEAEKSIKTILALPTAPVEKRRLIDTVLRKLQSAGYEAVVDTILKSLPPDMKESDMPDPNQKDVVTKADMEKAIQEAVAKAASAKDEEVKKAREAAEKAAEERIAKAEKIAAEAQKAAEGLVEVANKRERLAKAETITKGVTGAPTPEELEPILKGLTDDQVKVLTKAFDAARAQQAEAGKILKTDRGSTAATGAGSAYQQAVTKAQEIKKTDSKMTDAAALAKVWLDNPKLYDQYLAESGSGARQ